LLPGETASLPPVWALFSCLNRGGRRRVDENSECTTELGINLVEGHYIVEEAGHVAIGDRNGLWADCRHLIPR